MRKRQGAGVGQVVFKTLVLGWVLVAVLHVASVLLTHYSGNSWEWLTPKFDVDNEFNVPTIYNGLLWGISAFVCLVLVGQGAKRLAAFRWGLLGAFFLYLAFDELMMLHEGLGEPVRKLLMIGDSNPLYHAWVVPALVVTVAIGGFFVSIKAAKDMGRAQKRVVLYVLILAVGVISLEIIGTKLYVSPLVYKLGPVMAEELFEIGMASLILYTVTGYALSPVGDRVYPQK